jgi:molybdopterin molybdotransferase
MSVVSMTEGHGQPRKGYFDPRMRGFRTRHSVDDVLRWIDANCAALGSERVSLHCASGRILDSAVEATNPVPHFDRAAMDGFAVKGEETFGADSYTPAVLRVVGESWPGRGFEGHLGVGEAVRIMTGAPLPAGADCVVKVESTEADDCVVRVFEPTPPGRHVGRCGEDIPGGGTKLLSPGRCLRPQDLGVLSAVGQHEISVVRQPRVTIIVTGDELLPAGSPAQGHQIADMNSVMLEALVTRDGGNPRVLGPLADDRDLLRRALLAAAGDSDLVLVSGGSSTGLEDHAPGLLAELGDLPIHGVALRPASPSGLGRLRDAFVVLLPGNPVSCLCAYDLFGGRILRRLGGRSPDWPYRAVTLPLAQTLVSTLGRVDYARVRIADDQIVPLEISGASILSSTTRADGFVLVPPDSEGYPSGARVTAWRYDS